MSSSICSSTSSNDSLLNILLGITDRKYTILTCHTDEYAEKFLLEHLPRDVAFIIARYVVDGQVMDRQGWLKVFGVDIGDEANRVMQDLDFDRFYAVYHGPNPIDVMDGCAYPRQVCESSLIPTIVPKRVMVEGRVFEYNLNLLGELTQYKGINGHRARYSRQTLALAQHGEDGVEKTHLHIQLKDVVARCKSWKDQVVYLTRLNFRTGYGCTIEPRALAQITTIFATYALTGNRYYSDGISEGLRPTWGRTAEIVENAAGDAYHMVSGNFGTAIFGPFGELSVDSCDGFESLSFGVGIQRKFG